MLDFIWCYMTTVKSHMKASWNISPHEYKPNSISHPEYNPPFSLTQIYIRIEVPPNISPPKNKKEAECQV